jgi:hypothetical protein
MQVNRTAEAPDATGSVRGLGVCDVLQVGLLPLQRAELAAQLAARAHTLERRYADVEGMLRLGPQGPPAARALEETDDELRLLARIRESLPADADERFALAGPAGLVLDLTRACAAAAMARAVTELEASRPCPDELEAAAAWITTMRECEAVETYCFEPGVDPLHAW